MSNITQYEQAKAVLADIDARKDSVLQAFNKATNGFGLYISAKDYDYEKGCICDALNEVFHKVEREAKLIKEAYERSDTINAYHELRTVGA